MRFVIKILRSIFASIGALILILIGLVYALAYSTIVTMLNQGTLRDWAELISGFFEGLKMGFQETRE